MKKLLTVVMAGLLLAAFALPAFAWEFSMTGEYDFRFRYWSRIGDKDLFGLAAAQDIGGIGDSRAYTYQPVFYPGDPTVGGPGAQLFTVPGNTRVGLAGPNFYGSGQIVAANSCSANALVATPNYGTIITRGGLADTSSDGIYADQRLTLVPNIRVNPAIRVHGVYNIGGIRNRFNQTNSGMGIAPFERYGAVSTVTGSQDTAGIGSWEQVRATVRTPWGILSYGMKDFPFGLGLFTSQRTRGSAFVMVVPYGPFRFIPAFWHGNSVVNGTYTENYRPSDDNKAFWFGGFLFTYDSGALSAGGGWVGRNYHYNKFMTGGLVGPPVTGAGLGQEQIINCWAWFLKFNNGRFFANGEFDWANIDTPFILPSGTQGLQRPGNYVEQYHAFGELGVMAGPTKFAGMWAQVSGPVRNNYGALDQNRAGGGTGINPKTYSTWGIDWQVLDPYQYLMFGTYAGGNQTFAGLFLGDDGKGFMSDAMALALRLDYAVAANLNVYGTYMWAKRLESYGTYMGQYYSDGRDTTAANFAASTNPGLSGSPGQISGATARANFRSNVGSDPAAGPTHERFVPDNFLGWELNVGVDWKLLEHMTARMRYAYWQPGEWFNFAYQAVVPDAGTVTSFGYLGTRDPIQAFEGSFIIDF